MFYFEEFPNELILIIYSYLKTYELIKSFYQLNKRLNNLLLKYIFNINLSSKLKQNQLKEYLKLNSFISSLIIDNYQIGNYFIEKFQIKNFYQIKLIDNGIDLYEQIFNKFKPEILNIVITSLNHQNKSYQFLFKDLKRLEIEFQIGEYAKNCLLNQFNLISPSILVHIRIIFPKLSEYFHVFNCQYSIHIEKLYISIFSIDNIDNQLSTINLPYLNDFQLEICEISFDLIKYILPSNNKNNCLKRFAFIGQTTTINAKLWKNLLKKYNLIEQFHLHLSNIKSFNFLNIEQWKYEFPQYSIDYNSLKQNFQIHLSKFDYFQRLLLNESIEKNLNHIQYLNKINHLIIRSQYWCSYINLSLNLQNKLFTNIKHLTINYRQLEYFLNSTKFLNQIEQLDLEFTEQYCFIENHIADKLIHLKSLSLSSIYDGIHQIKLHTIIKEILFKKFAKLIYLYIDSIEIIDEQHVENSVLQWFSYLELNQPIIHYIQGKYFSIWF